MCCNSITVELKKKGKKQKENRLFGIFSAYS